MSRNGSGASRPSRTIRIAPPFSTTNSRSLPSPALTTASGACRPSATGSRLTDRPVGSNGPVGLGWGGGESVGDSDDGGAADEGAADGEDEGGAADGDGVGVA